MAAGLLAAPALAATAAPEHAGRQASATSRLPLSARQMLADQHMHAQLTHATGSVTGLAQAPDGQPLAGICVDADGPAGERFGVTDATGRYFISGMRYGSYSIRYQSCSAPRAYVAQWYAGAASRSSARPVEVAQQRTQSLAPVTLRTPAETAPTGAFMNTSSTAAAARALAAALGLPATTGAVRPASAAGRQRGGRISGRVTAQDGKALPGICVLAVASSGPGLYFTEARTGTNGRYETDRSTPARYAVAFFPECGNRGNWIAQVRSKTVRVVAGRTTAGINAVLKPGGEISGTVTSATGHELSGICADAVRLGVKEPPASGTAFYLSLSIGGMPSSHGVYHVHGVPAGRYKVYFAPCTDSTLQYLGVWWRGTLSMSKARVLRLRRTQLVTGVNEVLPLGGTISGTVTDGQGHPLAGICANAGGPEGDEFPLGGATGGGTSAGGHYEIEGLYPGKYQVEFSAGCGNNGNYLAVGSRTFAVAIAHAYPGVNASLPAGVTISGTVTSAATGKPVKGICVSVWGGPQSGLNAYSGDEISTRANGTYVINNQVPPGTYYVDFSGGCGNPGSYGQVAYGSPSPNSPAPITLSTDGQKLSGVSVAMDAGATVSGTVTSSRDQPLSGICVAAVSGGYEENQATSVDGRYSVGNLPPGEYQVEFSSGCGDKKQDAAEQYLAYSVYRSDTDQAYVSAPAGTTGGIDGVLPEGGGISGKVLTKSGRKLPSGCVALTGLSGSDAADSGKGLAFDGSYQFTGVLPGLYTVTFLPGCVLPSADETQWYKDKSSPAGAARVRIRAGRITKNISGAVVPGGSIAGTISSHGKPVQGLCVLAQNVSQVLDFGQAYTGKSGRYVITGLNSGRYELEVEPCFGGFRYADSLLPRVAVVTAPRQTRGVNGTAQLGGSIDGKVLGDSPVTPQAGICVDALAANGTSGNSTATGNDGSFSLTNLAAGKYYVYVNDVSCAEGPNDLASQWYPAAPTQQSAATVTVTAGGTTSLPGVTLPQLGGISGTVTAAGNGALPGACVIAKSTGPGSVPVYATSMSSGQYALLGLQPGRYKVEFSSGCGSSGYEPQWWAGKVTVTAGNTTTGISATLHK
jgi:Carboxypeptidase regulatory-like domain